MVMVVVVLKRLEGRSLVVVVVSEGITAGDVQDTMVLRETILHKRVCITLSNTYYTIKENIM